MAGKRMKLNSYQQLFSTQAVQIATLRNWSEAIDMPELHKKLNQTSHLFDEMRIGYTDTKQVQSILGVHSEMLGRERINLTCSHSANLIIDSCNRADILEQRVCDVQQGINSAVNQLLYLNTWRAMIRQQPNPMPGFDFNITIPGIVVACLLLGVAVDFESE